MEKFRRIAIVVFDSVSAVSARCVLRVALWAITVVGGLLPPIFAADVEPSLSIHDVAAAVNNVGLFRDFFYITVVIALIGLCNVLDVLFKGYRPHAIMSIGFVFGVAYCIYMIFFGIAEFGRLANHHEEKFVLSPERLSYDLNAMIAIGVVGLFIELLLAFRGE